MGDLGLLGLAGSLELSSQASSISDAVVDSELVVPVNMTSVFYSQGSPAQIIDKVNELNRCIDIKRSSVDRFVTIPEDQLSLEAEREYASKLLREELEFEVI